MWEFVQSTPAQAVIWVAVLAVLSVLGTYLVKLFRGEAGENPASSSELLTGFRELHDGGDLTRQEFRNIKTVLGPKLQDDLPVKDSGDDG